MKLRRINLYGGSGIGKSKNASGLFYALKEASVAGGGKVTFELVPEYVKQWAYLGRKPRGFEQNYLFAKQQHSEEVSLLAGVDCVVTDSPLLLNCAYAKAHDVPSWEVLTELAMLHEGAYPGIHIFLDRGDRPYVQKGRYEDEAGARKMDDFIREFITEHLSGNFRFIHHDDLATMLEVINGRLSNDYFDGKGSL